MQKKLECNGIMKMENLKLFNNYPFAHYIREESIDLYYHQHQLCNKLDHYDQIETMIINEDVLHFNGTLKQLKSLKVQFDFLTINNSNNYPYSKLLLKEESLFFNARIEVKVLILFMEIKFKKYIVIDMGSEFNVALLLNIRCAIEKRNDERITNFLNFMMLNNRFAWDEFIKPKVKTNRNGFKCHNAKLIRDKFSFRIIDFRCSLSDLSLFRGLF